MLLRGKILNNVKGQSSNVKPSSKSKGQNGVVLTFGFLQRLVPTHEARINLATTLTCRGGSCPRPRTVSVQRLLVEAALLLRMKKIASPTTTTAIIPPMRAQLTGDLSSKLAVME